MDDSELLLRHLLDLSKQAETRNCYTYSGFLSLPEQDAFLKLAAKERLSFTLFGGSEAAERQIVIFGREEALGYPPAPPVSVLQISPRSEKYGEILSHRDYMGAILNLGIDRALTGDIVVREKQAWLFCLDSIRDFLTENLTRVRHTEVQAEVCSGTPPELAPRFEELRLNVASPRLDSVVSELTGIPRTKIRTVFSEQRVAVNGRIQEDSSKQLKDGDILTVRGFGKVIYDGEQGRSKKGRLYVAVRKYV